MVVHWCHVIFANESKFLLFLKMAELESHVYLWRPYCTNPHKVMSLVVEDPFMFGVYFVLMQNIIWFY